MRPIKLEISTAASNEAPDLKIESPSASGEPGYSVQDGRLLLHLPLHIQTRRSLDLVTEILVSVSREDLSDMTDAMESSISDK